MKLFLFLLISFFSLLILPSPIYAGNKIARESAKLVTPVAEEDLRREKVLKEYLAQYNSPLAPVANVFVDEADRNKLDWKLLVAISGVESTFAKHYPYNSYNAWGWGIYGDNMIRFRSWNEAISTISKELKERYIDQWKAEDVYQIGRYYAASPTWAQRVEYFVNDIQKFENSQKQEVLPISI